MWYNMRINFPFFFLFFFYYEWKIWRIIEAVWKARSGWHRLSELFRDVAPIVLEGTSTSGWMDSWSLASPLGQFTCHIFSFIKGSFATKLMQYRLVVIQWKEVIVFPCDSAPTLLRIDISSTPKDTFKGIFSIAKQAPSSMSRLSQPPCLHTTWYIDWLTHHEASAQ